MNDRVDNFLAYHTPDEVLDLMGTSAFGLVLEAIEAGRVTYVDMDRLHDALHAALCPEKAA